MTTFAPSVAIKSTLSEEKMRALSSVLANVVTLYGDLIARYVVIAFNVGIDVKKMTYNQLEEEKERQTHLLYNQIKEVQFQQAIEEIAAHIICRNTIFERAKLIAGREKFERAIDGSFSIERILTALIVRTKQQLQK